MNLLPNVALIFQLVFSSLTNQYIFKEGVLGQPSNLVPYLGRQNEADKAISQIIYPQLVDYNLRGDLEPCLAESWEISEDGLEYRFIIKDDVYWNNGRKISSDDIIFTAQNAPSIQNVEVSKVNDLEVKFFLKEPFAPFLSTLTLKIIPKEAKIGLKPITLETRRIARVSKSGDRVEEILVYLGDSVPHDRIKFIAYKFFNHSADIKMAADLGEVDGFEAIDFNNNNFYGIGFPLRARRYGLFFNLKNDKLKNSSLRRQLAQGLDKKKIINEALGGLGEPISIPNLDFLASQKLSQPLSLTLTVANDEQNLKVASFVKDYWEDMGARVDVLPLPFWDISTRVIDTKDFEVLLFGQETWRDPDEYTLWHSTKTRYPGLNIAQLDNARVDNALASGRKEMDPEKRQEHYDNFMSLLNEEVPAVFIYRPVYHYFVSKKYKTLLDSYLLDACCCDGCQCVTPKEPILYYPQERF